MEAIFIWMGKTIFTSGVMFGYYQLFLKDKTFHHYNRFYLLATVLISLFLPLLKVDYFTLEVNSNMYLILNKIQNLNSTNTLNNDSVYPELIFAAFGLVSLFFLGRFLFGILRIFSFKRKYSKENFEGISFYQTNLTDAPFSFFKSLFWKDTILIQSDLGRQILKHEMVHVEQKHSYDKMVMEVIVSIFWFNPFYHLIKKEISLIHEYLADKKALKNSDTKAFAQMLLAGSFSGKVIPGTSPFLSSNLKKRLIMLKKSKTKYGYARKILALPILFALGFIYLVNAKNREIRNTNEALQEMVKVQKLLKVSDTIKPNSSAEIQANIKKLQDEIEPTSKALQEKQEEIRNLGNEMREKGDELRKLSDKKDFDNPKFDKLSLEMDNLGKKMDNLFNSAEMKEHWAKMDEHFKEMDKQFANLDQFYNSVEFKNQFKNAEEMEKKLNSPEFQKKIKEAEKRAKEAEKKFNSPKFQQRLKDAEKRAKEAEKIFNSPEFQQRIKDAGKRAKEARANMSEKSERMTFLNGDRNYIVLAPKESQKKPKVFLNGDEYNGDWNSISPQNIESINVKKETENGEIWVYTKDSPVKFKNEPQNLSFKEDVYDRIYINGKLSTLQELKSIRNDNIENVNVNKANNNEKRNNEIRITTNK